jgi:hypothetical protein
MRHIIHPGRGLVEETPRITLDDLRAWRLLPRPGEERRGIITLSRDGVKTGSVGVAVRIDGVRSFIGFDYFLGEEKKPVKYQHGLEFFPCRFGGHRLFFRCGRCFRRVTALYLSRGYYACRHCHRLAYLASQAHGTLSESLDRAESLRSRAKRLRAYRHPRKANRLLRKAEELRAESWLYAARWLGRRGKL